MIAGAEGETRLRLGPEAIHVRGGSAAWLRALVRAFDAEPEAADGREPALRIDLDCPQRPPAGAERLGDAGDGLHVAVHGGRAWWRRDGRWGWVAAGERPVVMGVNGAERIWRLAPVVRSVARQALPGVGAAAIHASLVEHEGTGILVSGWSESGKTEVSLALAARLGGRLVGDKWVVVRDASAWAVPGTAGLRGWVVPYLDGATGDLTRVQRARLGAEGLARGAGRLVSRARAIHPVADALGEPFSALIPQVPVVRVPPGALAPGGGGTARLGSVPVRATVLLLGGSGPARRPMEPAEIGRRIAATTAFEENLVLPLGARAAYAGVPWFEEAALQAVLASAIGRVPAHAISLPFPADPRPAADLIASLL